MKKIKSKIVTKLRLKKKYAVLLLVLGGISLFALVLGFGLSYAFFTTSTSGSDVVVYTGNLQVNYTKTGNVVNLTNTYPKNNADGLSQDGYTFNITNTGNLTAKYLT